VSKFQNFQTPAFALQNYIIQQNQRASNGRMHQFVNKISLCPSFVPVVKKEIKSELDFFKQKDL
jgi:hypothetical protein